MKSMLPLKKAKVLHFSEVRFGERKIFRIAYRLYLFIFIDVKDTLLLLRLSQKQTALQESVGNFAHYYRFAHQNGRFYLHHLM